MKGKLKMETPAYPVHPEQERCPKYPSMRKAHCAHCQGTERGTADNPKFSLKEYYFHGYPIVEVLKNGGPVNMWDEHFRFGQRKAEILIACVAVLREFWQSSDESLAFKPQLIENQRRGLRIQIYVEMHPDFELSTGAKIDRPWLRLQALAPDDAHHVGLGMMKCRAICAVEEDLKHWLRRHGVPE